MNLELDEADRQLVLMALAHLSVDRPGWDDALNRIAMRIDNVRKTRAAAAGAVEENRAALYDELRALHTK